MSSPATRLTRLVHVARLREERARHDVGAARASAHRADADVHAVTTAMGDVSGGLGVVAAVHRMGRAHLGEVEHRAGTARMLVEDRLTAWRHANHRLGSLERLDDRLRDELLAARLRRERHEADDLAATRGSRP